MYAICLNNHLTILSIFDIIRVRMTVNMFRVYAAGERGNKTPNISGPR